MLFEIITSLVAVAGGAIASVTGFGIGSTLTPLLTYRSGAKLAVAAVSIPHLTGTVIRLWQLRKDIDYRVLWTFGSLNAVGGLAGAVVHTYAQGSVVRIVFGVLLVFAGMAGVTGLADRIRFGQRSVWVAGFVSGGLGGFSGTQGGIRAAAMFGFELSKTAFVATSTAISFFVDAARMPVYLWTEWNRMGQVWPFLVTATAGVLVGTLAGERILRSIPERLFRKIASALILALGIAMIFLINSERGDQ